MHPSTHCVFDHIIESSILYAHPFAAALRSSTPPISPKHRDFAYKIPVYSRNSSNSRNFLRPKAPLRHLRKSLV